VFRGIAASRSGLTRTTMTIPRPTLTKSLDAARCRPGNHYLCSVWVAEGLIA